MSSSSSSANNDAGAGNDSNNNDNHQRNIGIISPVPVAAAAASVAAAAAGFVAFNDDEDDDGMDELSLSFAAAAAFSSSNNKYKNNRDNAAAASDFPPLAATTVAPHRNTVTTPYSTNSSNKNLIDSPLPSLQQSAATAENNNNKKEVIVVNVGGYQYTTSRSTLCNVPGSQLEAMFSGRHLYCAYQMENGSYFIDRDGCHFRHILNFLRTGTVVTLPKTENERHELAIEADYYGLDGLVRAIRMPKLIDFDSLHMNDKDNDSIWKIRQDECEIRAAFFMNHNKKNHYITSSGLGEEEAAVAAELSSFSISSSAVILSDPFHGLIPIYSPTDGIPMPLKFNPDCHIRKKHADCLFMTNVCIQRSKEQVSVECPPVCVDSLEAFKTNFNKEWPNVLHRIHPILLDEPVVLAGGSVLRALTASNQVRTGGAMWGDDKPSDIDVFVYARTASEASRITRRIFYALAVDEERWVVIRSRGVVNIHHFGARSSVETKIQIVLRLYDSPTEVLMGFDVDCCLCAYDGRNVWLAPRCVSALESGTNILNPLHAWPNRPSYEIRLAKYAVRGFAVYVPGIDRHRVDYPKILKSDLKDLKGMARFIKVASEMESATKKKRFDWRRSMTVERAKTPREIEALKEGELSTTTEDERVIDLRCERDEIYDEVNDVIVPRIYGEDETAIRMDWTYDGNFPPSRESRDAAWEDIMDPGEERCPVGIPQRLDNAWDTAKRSREYLNGSMDKFDLDNLYYSHAYCEHDNSTSES